MPPWRGERFLGLRRADKADGHADDRCRLRRALIDQLEQTEQGRRRIADGDERPAETVEPEVERSGRARGVEASGAVGDAGSIERADDLVAGGEPRAGDAVRHHLRVAEDRLPREECAARRGDEAGAEHEVAGDLDHAAGMDDAHGDAGLVFGEARKVRFAADDGEGAPIDLGAVAGVIVLGTHGRGPLADWSKASI